MQEQKSPLSDSFIQSQDHEFKFNYKIWLSKDPKFYDLYLTHRDSYLIIGSKEGDSQQDIWLKTNDIIGFNQQDVDQEWKKITLNVFSKKKKFMRKMRRYLSHYTFYVNITDYGNQKINALICDLMTISTNKQHKSKQRLKKFMIYFNPNSGSNSKKHLDRVIDFMAFTCCSFDILTTQRRNHCKQHIDNQLNMKSYDAIVIISGDGLMHQFVNSKAAGVVPVTHVPAGSGNAFAKYQTTLAVQACQDQEAIFLAIKGKIKHFNLSEFYLENVQSPIYSFLSFEWCFMADIDMNSQFLRFLGGLRFEIYGVWRLFAVRKYKGKFTYSLNSTNIPPLNVEINDNHNFHTQEKVYLHQIITFIPWISDSYEISPLLEIQDQSMDLQTLTQENGRIQLAKYMLNCQSGNHFDRRNRTVKQGYHFDWKKIKSFRLQPNGEDIGVFGIDGERYEAQKVQAKISDKKVLTFT